jgi:hypothetical protein
MSRFVRAIAISLAVLLVACGKPKQKGPPDVADTDDIASLQAQVEIPFKPKSAHYLVYRHQAATLPMRWPRLLAVMEIDPAEKAAVLAKLRALPTTRKSELVEEELDYIKGPLAKRVRDEVLQNHASTWHAPLSAFKPKAFPVEFPEDARVEVFDSGLVFLYLEAHGEDTK